ncbi:MAG: tail fiber domain-containing protein [Bacteroidota bacterium]
MKKLMAFFALSCCTMMVTAQNAGIGTTTPNANALLHIDLGASLTKGVLVTGTFDLNGTVPNLGSGTRMMFFPGKSAFRAGVVSGTQWDNANVGRYSTAFGVSTTASGYASTAIGAGTIASGFYALASGQGTTASADNSTATGENSVASGEVSTAMGGGTTASGSYATAAGYLTTARSSYAVAMGFRTLASGFSALALGDNTTASGSRSTALGRFTTASGSNATALGYYTDAGGDYSTVMGIRTVAKGYGSAVLGMYNDSILLADETAVTATTPLFIIGNGSDSTTRSNALVVRKDGKIGIGENAPLEKLHVENGNILMNNTNATFQLQSGGVEKGFVQLSGNNLRLGTNSSNATGNFIVRVANGDRLVVDENGNVGIGTSSPSQKLHVAGNICYTGSIAACSDIRYKKDILPVSHALSSILSMQGIYYNWNRQKFPGKGFGDERQLGFSAQQVESLFPEIVQTDEQGYKAVDYSRLTPILVEAIKEQQKQIMVLNKNGDEMQMQISKQQMEMNEKQEQIDALKLAVETLKKLWKK